MHNNKADRQTSKWLKDNGLNEQYFADMNIETHLIQAQMIASNILKFNVKQLGQNEVATLNNFLQAMANKAKRAKLTTASAYKIMNIGTAVNRKMFKSAKKLKRR
jgi:hypothetical protein